MSRFKIDGGQGNGFSPGAYYRESEPARIDPESEEDLMKWQTSLQITRTELMEAIKLFGLVVRDIRRGLVEQNANKDESES